MNLSLIIPVYNSASTIDSLLISILAQKNNNIELEIVIVNDGSSDQSRNLLDNYSKNHKYIKVYHTENHGVYKARNLALTKITGEYVWMLDADDYISENAFDVIYKILKTDNYDVINFGYKFEELKGNFQVKYTQKNENQVIDGVTFLAKNDGRLYLWNNIYNLKFLKENDLKFYAKSVSLEDSLFNLNVFVKAKKVLLSKEVLYTYAFHEESISRNRDLEHLTKRVESSYNVHKQIQKLRDSFKKSSFTFKILNERLSHSILGFFYWLLNERFSKKTVLKMHKQYQNDGLIPINYNKTTKLKLFSLIINSKLLFKTLVFLNNKNAH